MMLSYQEQTVFLNDLAKRIESSRESASLSDLEEAIETAGSADKKKLSAANRATLYFFIANAWGYIQNIKHPNESIPIETKELEYQIINLRNSIREFGSFEDHKIQIQVLTNLGNLFSHLGRFSEAQEYFEKALDINRDFGMAQGNKGFALYYYARVLYEPNQQYIFLCIARKYLLRACEAKDVYSEAKEEFFRVACIIEKMYPNQNLHDIFQFKNYFKTLSKKEQEYRCWCMVNKLFLNPLNDILQESVVAHDYLFTPPMILEYDEKPVYQTIYNQLKQEYVSARFLYFEGVHSDKTHFSDRNVALMDTLDYSNYSLALEKIKAAFRICYSLFDKIAYFINIYLKLGIENHKVTFRTIWFETKGKERKIRNEIHRQENWALRGLYWLSKDFEESDITESIEPESKELASIRNYLEHKAFKIVDVSSELWLEKGDVCIINRDYFIQKTLKILKLSRSALMYLSFIVFDEERQRDKKRDTNVGTLTVDFLDLPDDEKL